MTDALTGLPGPKALRAEMARLTRVAESFSLLSLDLDGFKAVNGSTLCERGNRLLRRTAQTIAALSPEGAMVVRWGGDEFAILVATDAVEEAFELADRICAAVAAFEIPESDEDFRGPPRVTCSIGVARYPVDGQTADDLLRAADSFMYQAKRAGGGGVAAARPIRPPLPDRGSGIR